MNKRFLMTLMLASGMAFAQSGGGSAGSMDQQQPSTQQTQPTSSQAAASAGQNSLTGCLKGSGDAWVLIVEGQSTPVTGDSSKLKAHNGHQVQVKGTPASDGSFQVTDVVMIADSCPSQQSAASPGGMTGAAAGESASATSETAQKLPQTASPLPLLGLLGLGSLVSGLVARRKKK